MDKAIEAKKKEYNKLLNRYFNAEKWFYQQDSSYFDNVEDKKEYKAFIMIIDRLKILYNEIKGY